MIAEAEVPHQLRQIRRLSCEFWITLMQHLVTLLDLTPNELNLILEIGSQVKSLLRQGIRPDWCSRYVMAMIFEKPSLRTRVSFEAGIAQMGGTAMYLGKEVGWPHRESTADFIRVLAQYADCVVCRANSHQSVADLASHDCVPVINGLTDLAHPCQALADLMTIQEVVGNFSGKTLVFVGDGNNVAYSLAIASAMVGMRFRLLGPNDYFIKDTLIQDIISRYPDADILQSSDSKKLLPTADFLYTDVWTSMGQEAEASQRVQAFSPFQVNGHLLSLAKSDCHILHCLPAKRGQEITDEVIDSPRSVVIEQAGNRMHAQKGLHLWMAVQNHQLDAQRLSDYGIRVATHQGV
jgi:ornithine carbamoyltransferase